jgi:multimeric flavodoxin WrbA
MNNKNMKKYLFISGSPRKGNTEFILNKIYNSIDSEKEIVLLRNENINQCAGCLYCDKHKKCIIKDDMQEVYEKMIKADIFIIGTPNYYDNVPGLLKNFIDRTNPFYETDKIKKKKLINIIVGGGSTKNSKRVEEHALKYFYDCHKLDLAGSFFFQALGPRDIEKNPKTAKEIEKIIKLIKNEPKRN